MRPGETCERRARERSVTRGLPRMADCDSLFRHTLPENLPAMDFEALPPDFGTKLRGGWSWDIFASGDIDGSDGELLQNLIVKNNIPPGSELYIHSGGGSALGGISLGRAIREFQLVTHVGQKGRFKNDFQFSEPGSCISAAALAFLGGEYRFVSGGSKFGVHRFSFDDGSSGNADAAQRLSATIVEYIRSMDVDIELFSIASEIPANDILIIPNETLSRLKVINNGQKDSKWTIESLDGVLYLKGERETIYGLQKFLVVFPAKSEAYLHIIFDIGQSADLAMMMEWDQFVLDGVYILAADFRINRWVENGMLNAMYSLPPDFLSKMLLAKTVGYCLQFTEEAPVFIGFDRLPCRDGAAKLPGLISLHGRSRE
jgi:hypothetical protein